MDASIAQRPDQAAKLSLEPVRPNEISQRINSVVAELRRAKPTWPSLYIIRQGTHPSIPFIPPPPPPPPCLFPPASLSCKVLEGLSSRRKGNFCDRMANTQAPSVCTARMARHPAAPQMLWLHMAGKWQCTESAQIQVKCGRLAKPLCWSQFWRTCS